MADKLFIPIILGTVREGRASEAVAHFMHTKLLALPDVQTKLIDIRTLDIPWNDEGQALAKRNQGFVDDIIRADGLVIVSPEYNHGYPGSLKRALDVCFEEYERKAVGVVGVSNGMIGGARMIEQLSQVVRRLGLSITKTDLLFPRAPEAFNEDGSPKDEKTHERCAVFLNELLFLAHSLKWGRENISE
ncbi:NAD(P)H-dependent oxidoreductase [Patescibacteria group bacterium]|jgi:NAD(P)H-dependent FMN reductase|nr:NAD(P)H-dependent oxidoreductase [Patescibacteria group bacterium]